MGYTVQEIIDDLEQNPQNIMILYRRLAKMKYSWEASEKLCGFLLNHFELFDEIPNNLAYATLDKSSRGWHYLEYRRNNRNGEPQTPNPDKKYNEKGKHTRAEDYLAMDIFRLGRKNDEDKIVPIAGVGYVLDYQMCIGWDPKLLKIKKEQPYKNNKYPYYGIPDPDKCNYIDLEKKLFRPGKCDLIAYDDGRLIVYELKYESNTEPMIRAVLEAYTYLRMLDKERATESLRNNYNKIIPNSHIPWEARLLLYAGGFQNKEYTQDKYSYLRKLIEKLEITVRWYTTDFSLDVV